MRPVFNIGDLVILKETAVCNKLSKNKIYTIKHSMPKDGVVVLQESPHNWQWAFFPMSLFERFDKITSL